MKVSLENIANNNINININTENLPGATIDSVVSRLVGITGKSFPKFNTSEVEKDARALLEGIAQEDLDHVKVWVTPEYRLRSSPLNALKGFYFFRPMYTLALEKAGDFDAPSKYILKLIINTEDKAEELKRYFRDLGLVIFEDVWDEICNSFDPQGKLVVKQMNVSLFNEAVSEKTGFALTANCQAVARMGEVLFTSIRYNEEVFLKFPQGLRPWNYRAEFSEGGKRVAATWEVRLYGPMWYDPSRRRREE